MSLDINFASREKLKVIAERAMIQRGLLPNFSLAVLAETDAIVTGASEKGTWVRIFRPAVEGRVVRGFEGLDIGDSLIGKKV